MSGASNVNIPRLKQASTEMEKISTLLYNNERRLAETMTELAGVWHGEAANSYLRAFEQNLPEFQKMSKLLRTTSETLKNIALSYDKQESMVSDMIKSKLAKG